MKQRDDEAERIRQDIEASYTPEQWSRIQHFKDILVQKRQGRGY